MRHFGATPEVVLNQGWMGDLSQQGMARPEIGDARIIGGKKAGVGRLGIPISEAGRRVLDMKEGINAFFQTDIPSELASRQTIDIMKRAWDSINGLSLSAEGPIEKSGLMGDFETLVNRFHNLKQMIRTGYYVHIPEGSDRSATLAALDLEERTKAFLTKLTGMSTVLDNDVVSNGLSVTNLALYGLLGYIGYRIFFK
jgi:hypothetical protein